MGNKFPLPNTSSGQLLSLIQTASQASPLSHTPCPTPCKGRWAIPKCILTPCSFLFLHFTKTLSELPSCVSNILNSIYQASLLLAIQKRCSKSPQATVRNISFGWSTETNRKGPSDFRAEKKQRARIAAQRVCYSWSQHKSPSHPKLLYQIHTSRFSFFMVDSKEKISNG